MVGFIFNNSKVVELSINGILSLSISLLCLPLSLSLEVEVDILSL